MKTVRRLSGLLWLAALGACASAPRTPGDGLARLEQAHQANPSSVPVMRSLGVAYYDAQRYQQARDLLDEALNRNRSDGVAALYAGMSAEQLGDLPAARTYYTSYIQNGRTASVRNQLRAKLADLDRKELVASARASIAREATISATPGDQMTIAVSPLRFTGTDTTLRPLERGIAELLITDLGRVQRLRVVERDRLQVLLNEIALSQAGRVDDATAVRGGRLVAAGRLVAGTIAQSGTGTGAQLNVSTTVINTTTSLPTPGGNGTSTLNQLFDMEKDLALRLLDALGVPPTEPERRLIAQRPTQSVTAFLAYSQGLEALDRGDLTSAARFFQDATRIDPSFGLSTQRSQQVQSSIEGAAVTTATVEAGLAGTAEGNVAAAAQRGDVAVDSRLTTLNATSQDLVPSAAAAAASAGTSTASTPSPSRDAGATTGTDDVGQATGTIRIVIPQPPGGE